MYTPNLGVWLQRDPAEEGLNLYEYVGDNPTTKVDPLGLAAWVHKNYWDASWIQTYRDYVKTHAADYLGRTEDCADLSMTVLVEFASANGLPVTFRLLDGHLIISKSCKWDSKEQFLKFAKQKIGAKALLQQNMTAAIAIPPATAPATIPASAPATMPATAPATAPSGNTAAMTIAPGDLIISISHAAVVVNAMGPGELSDGQERVGGMIRAKPGVRTWDEAAAESAPDDLKWIYNPTSTAGVRVDYLNHRGSAKRQKAEMIYNRDANDLIKGGYEFRFWHKIVFSNYENWDGWKKLPDEY